MFAPLRFVCALSFVAPLAAGAGDLEIAPILVELSPDSRTALVTVRNTGTRSMRYQARVFAWAQEGDGRMALGPATDLFLFPPLLELQPGESRNLRLGTDAASGPVERSWRLFVEELPGADSGAATNQVRVLTRVGVPVFLAPRARVSKAEISFLPAEGARVRFTLRNAGTIRLRPRSVTVTFRTAAGEPVLERSLEAWYVLAGGERVYAVEVPPGVCARTADLIAVAALEDGAIVGRAAGCRAP